MDRRQFMRQTVGVAGAVSALGAPSARSQQNPSSESPDSSNRPNILFIMTDQQRWDCLGANGNSIIQTPNLDRLAERSANFTHPFVQAPVCVPSRACIFTGRYAHAHKNRVNYTPLDEDEVLMQRRLQEAGYRTALVGKTHLYYSYPPTPEEAARTGFDIVELQDGAQSTDPWSDYVKWRNERDPQKEIYYRELAAKVESLKRTLPPGTNPFRAAVDERYTDTTWTGTRTRERLRELARGEKPFFLFSSFWKPHSPFEVPVPFDSLYNDVDIPLPKIETIEEMRRLPLPVQKLALRGSNPPYGMDREELQWIYRSYYGSIAHIDREVGLILDTLDETGQADNTVVVFASDHGDQLLEHGIMGKNVFFEGSIRVPLTISFPSKITPGKYDDPIESIDLLPTLFELIGLPEPYACQGRTLMPLIGESEKEYRPREAVFSENVIPEIFGSTFQFEKDKGVKGIRHPDAKMVRTKRWKFNYYPEGFAELYDLENDPNEQRNLADDAAYKTVKEEMRERLLHWLTTSTETDQIAPKWLLT